MCARDRVRARTCLFPNCAYCFVVIAFLLTYQFPVLVLLVSFKWFLRVSATNRWRLPIKPIGFLSICISYHSSIHTLLRYWLCANCPRVSSQSALNRMHHIFISLIRPPSLCHHIKLSLVLTKSYIPSIQNPDFPVVLSPYVSHPFRYPLFIDVHRHP